MRNRVIKVRLSDGELMRIQAKRGTLRLACFVREAVLDGLPPIIPPINRAALAELQRLAGNLNQIARHANQVGGDLGDLDDLRRLIAALRLALIEVAK